MTNSQKPQGCFRNIPYEQTVKENAKRVDAYERAVAAYIREEISLEQIYRCWAEPIYGAFGETLR